MCNPVLPLRGAEVMMKPGTMMQEVAADQAIMQLMDARGTLMELKVTLLYNFADMHALPIAIYAIAVGNLNVFHGRTTVPKLSKQCPGCLS